MNYCPSLQRLLDDGYVNGMLVYLQNFTVISTMDPDLMFCRYCMHCGFRLTSHDHSRCTVIENMMKLGQLRRFNELFFFNLERVDKMKERKAGHPNYPQTFEMHYCPYCGGPYEFDPNCVSVNL